MNDVILGMPGPWADSKCETYDHYTTKIGGLPDWPFPKSCLPPDLLLCSACGSKTCLVAQVYAPISSALVKIEERTIYVFCCISLKCGSYLALRVQRSDSDDKVKAVTDSPSQKLNDLNPHGSGDEEGDVDDGEGLDLNNLLMAFSQAAIGASDSAKQSTPKKSKASKKFAARHPNIGEVVSNSLVFPCFYTYDEVEKSCKEVVSTSTISSSASMREKQDENDNNTQDEAWEEESYEYDKALGADRTYLKFKKRMDTYPMQCFRYSYGGKPLLATRELGDPKPCSLCGSPRHFEMQLMSPLLYFLLEKATSFEHELLGNWNWMTLLLYTCSKSCCEEAAQEGLGCDGWVVAKEDLVAQFEKLPPELI